MKSSRSDDFKYLYSDAKVSALFDIFLRRQRHSSFKKMTKTWVKRVYFFPNILRNEFRVYRLRRQGAQVGQLVMLGESEINGNAKFLCIGRGSSFGKCLIEIHDTIIIGKNVAINDGAKILSASHSLRSPEWKTKTKPIFINDFAWIAMNATILPGVTIGFGAVVAAGAVVRTNVPDFALAVGNPAEIFPERRSRNLDYEPVRFNSAYAAWIGNKNIDR